MLLVVNPEHSSMVALRTTKIPGTLCGRNTQDLAQMIHSSPSSVGEWEGLRETRIRRSRWHQNVKSRTRVARAVSSVSLMTLVFASRVSSFSTGGWAGARAGCRRAEGIGSCGGGMVRRRIATSYIRPRMVAMEGPIPSLSKEPSAGAAAAGAAPARATAAAGGQAAPPPVGEVTTGAGLAEAGVAKVSAEEQRSQRLRVATFFFFWYTFNVGYNLCTKFT